MQPNSFDVIRIPTNGPGDVSGLMALIDSGALEPSSILAVLGKTEGNGGVNDFTREYAVAALCNALSSQLNARSARGRGPHRVRDVGRHRGRVVAAHNRFHAKRPSQGSRRELRREAAERRRRAHPRLPARGDWPRRTDRRNDQGRRGGDARRIDRGGQRRAFCPDQMPATDQRARPERRRARQDDGHRERLYVDGLFARRVRHRRRQSARRDRLRGRRKPGAERLDALFIRRVVFGRHRAHAQCRHFDRQFAFLVEPVQNWPCRDEGCDRPSGGDAGPGKRRFGRA